MTHSDTHIILEAESLSVSVPSPRGQKLLVRGASFTVGVREVLIILGESGCGKTILSRSLTTLFPAGSPLRIDGSVVFEGRELLGLCRAEMASIRRKKIRYVFQEPMQSLNPCARIGRQLRLSAEGTGGDDRNLHDVLAVVGLDAAGGLPDRYPHELSTGMAQRVCIAMAILPSPALLVADEPTSAVDASQRRRILDLLVTIQQSRPMSLVLITHDLDVAERYGDRIIVMRSGEIVETAPRRAFFDAPVHPYSRLLVGAHAALQERAGRRVDS
jgi:ABC-type glutathione transport system ATPase component